MMCEYCEEKIDFDHLTLIIHKRNCAKTNIYITTILGYDSTIFTGKTRGETGHCLSRDSCLKM